MAGTSEIRFLPLGDRRVAYEVRGVGSPLVAPAWWVSHLELDWESERFRRFWEGVADGYSLIRYDRLGVGMSDRTGRWIVPIPGTTKPHRLEENIAAGDLELTADDLREIDDALSEAQGARYSEVNQRMIDRGDGSISSVLRSEIASSEGSLATNCGGVISTRGG